MKRNSSINSSMEHFLAPPKPPTSSSSESEDDEEAVVEHPPQTWGNHTGNTGNRKRLLSKQLSMKETTREAKWEKRRRQILQRKHSNMMESSENNEGPTVPKMEMKESALLMRRRMRVRSLTDEDLDELRGSIELGFGFNEEDGGQNLCDTLPALNLYFAVNRQLSDPKLWSPASTPTPTSSASTICGTPSPRSPNQQQQNGDDWKICNPGIARMRNTLEHRGYVEQVIIKAIKESRVYSEGSSQSPYLGGGPLRVSDLCKGGQEFQYAIDDLEFESDERVHGTLHVRMIKLL